MDKTTTLKAVPSNRQMRLQQKKKGKVFTEYEFNDRHLIVLEKAVEKGTTCRQEIMQELNMSRQAAWRILHDLYAAKLVKRIGANHSTQYVPTQAGIKIVTPIERISDPLTQA